MRPPQDDDELQARLQAADPYPRAPRPAPGWLDDLTGETMNAPETSTSPAREGRRTPWLVAAAAAVVAAGVGATVLLGGEQDEPPRAGGPAGPSASASAGAGATSTEGSTGGSTEPSPSAPGTLTRLTAPGAAPARCLPPSAEFLADAETAFDATVTSLGAGQVGLAVSRWYAGAPTARAVVDAPASRLGTLLLSVDFEEGGRYLVAANGGEVMVCGFSGPYDASLAALYAQAFGS